MIPAANVLNMASRLIAFQEIAYYAFSSRQTQPNGQDIATYAAPVVLQASWQPVSRQFIQLNGLDFEKQYINIYVSQSVIDVARDVSGDLVTFNGNTYQCLEVTPWSAVDGWSAVLCVQIPNTPLVTGIIYPAAGTYTTGHPLTFTVAFNAPVTVTGTPYIALTPVTGVIGGNAAYTSGSGTNTLTFVYTVASGDTADGLTAASPVVTSRSNTIIGNGINANASFTPPVLTGVVLN